MKNFINRFIEDKVEYKKFYYLSLLCQSRHDEFISRNDAYHLYEQGWRWVDFSDIEDTEEELIRSLIKEFGEMNV